MGRCAELAPHLSVEELRNRFHSCVDARVKTHWQILWLRAGGQTTKDVAAATGFKPDWVRQIVRRYNKDGPEGIRNRVKDNGREPLLDEEQRSRLFDALQQRPPDGGLWSGPKVARWIEAETGREVITNKTGWAYLRALGFTLQRPRPRHVAARADGKQWLKKRSAATSRTFDVGTPRQR
jgi:transposase